MRNTDPGPVEKAYRSELKDRMRIVVKIGSSSLHHMSTGELNLTKMERLVRELCELKNQGKDVILVSSGAIAVGKKVMNISPSDRDVPVKQACAAVGQARLMMIYQKLFAEYNQIAAQILMTKNILTDEVNRTNAFNTFTELLRLGVIPIVNENDTVSTYEILLDDDDVLIGDNDTLSAIVASLIGADLLILLSDIDGLYTDDPRKNPNSEFIEFVDRIDDRYMEMGKASTGSSVGTGGMNTKMNAAKIATCAGVDMIIANSKDIRIIHRIMDGRNIGTFFAAHEDKNFNVVDFINNK